MAYSSGKIPNSVVNAVISTGRSRSSAASLTTVFNATSGKRARSSSMKLTRTMPLRIAMAKMAMKPTIAETLRYSPLSHSPATPPISPSGTPARISSAFLNDANAV